MRSKYLPNLLFNLIPNLQTRKQRQMQSGGSKQVVHLSTYLKRMSSRDTRVCLLHIDEIHKLCPSLSTLFDNLFVYLQSRRKTLTGQGDGFCFHLPQIKYAESQRCVIYAVNEGSGGIETPREHKAWIELSVRSMK